MSVKASGSLVAAVTEEVVHKRSSDVHVARAQRNDIQGDIRGT